MRFRANRKGCYLIVKGKMLFGENINEAELRIFSEKRLHCFLKVQATGRKRLKYTGPIGISLDERLDREVSKEEFYIIMEHIAVAIQKIKENDFSVNHVVWNTKNIYFSEITKELFFLYKPLVNCNTKIDINEFVESIVYRFKCVKDEEIDYIYEFLQYIRLQDEFDEDEIERYIEKKAKAVVDRIKNRIAVQSTFDKEIIHELRPMNKKTAHTFLEESAKTEPLRVENDDADSCPIITRVITGESTIVNKQFFRIGKEKRYVDFFIADNSTVSRGHADIITRGTRYYIKDLNSKNHTYVNGTMIPVEYEVEIHNGDMLKLSDEEFVFGIR